MRLRAQSPPVNTAQLDAAVAAAAASAAGAAASVVTVEGLVANAAISNRSFALLTDLTAVTGSFDGESASVWTDTEANNGVYSWDGVSAWVRVGDNPNQQLAVIRTAFEPLMPVRADLPSGTLKIKNRGGWVMATLSTTAMNVLTQNATWLSEAPGRFVPNIATGGRLPVKQADGWVRYHLDTPAAGPVAAGTATDGQVAAVLTNQVEDQPLLVGKNLFLGLGESTANGLDFMSNAFNILCTQYSTPKPAGATVDDMNQFHDGYTIDETIADWSVTKAAIDVSFAAGAECVSAILLNEMGNDMVALTDVDYWETRILQFVRMLQGYSMQKYLGTAPAAIMPTPPCFMTVIASWANGDLKTDIPLRAIEMARRIYDFGISTTEYIAAFSDNRHYLNTTEARRIASWGGIANYEWRINKRKLNPTQVIDSWFDGTAAFLRFDMPKPPLQVKTTLVSAITNNGLEAFTAAGAAITITGVTILANGRVVQVDRASPWVAGDQIWGAITPTTAGTAGRTTGPRSTFCDSSTYLIDLGGGAGSEAFQSYMLPFKLSLTQGTT